MTLSDCADQLEKTTAVYAPVTFEEIVIVMILPDRYQVDLTDR